MAGTRQGGKLAALKNKSKYGEDFYAKIGRKGGKNGKTGGFYANRELAREAGAKGGSISTRKGISNGTSKDPRYRLSHYEGTPDHPDVTSLED